MNKSVGFVATASLILLAMGTTGCKKKESAQGGSAASGSASTAGASTEGSTAGATDPAADPAAAKAAEKAAAAEAAEQAASDKANKQALLEYATMEDRYLNDPKGQWASAGKASSSYGNANEEPPDSQNGNTPWQATGAPNGETWSNNNQDLGIDWLELTYATPKAATEIRAVLTNGIGAISKVELVDEAGGAHEVWSGADETTRDPRGPRTWFIRTFDKTPYKVAKVKLSFANAVVTGYKEVDAVQLIGE